MFAQNNFLLLELDKLATFRTTEKWSFVDVALYYKRNAFLGSLLDGIFKRSQVVKQLYESADYTLAALQIDAKWKGDREQTQKVVQRYQK